MKGHHAMNKRILFISLLVFILAACSAQSAPDAQPQATPPDSTAVPTSALTESVAEDFFPVKAELRHARAFSVEYFDTYKVVTIHEPWRDAGTTFTYILVQRGTSLPESVAVDEQENLQVIEIPIRKIAALSTTHLPYLVEINALESLAAVGNAGYVNTPSVVARLQNGQTQSVGNGPEVNIESLLDINPDIITTTALGNPKKDDYQQLLQRGFKVLIVSDFMEETPLGRAEWIKFMSLFYNLEAEAENIFADIEERYQSMQALAASSGQRPTVIMGFEINGQWNMPGGKSYQAAYIRDAGGDYLWADDDSTGRIPLSFEAVIEKGLQADYWFNQSVSWLTAEDVLAADPRYSNFLAFQQGQVYNNNARLNETGGNDYNESGHSHPEVILADLISILHPELLPEHDLVYYRSLKIGE